MFVQDTGMKIWKPETSSDLARPSVDNQDTKPVVGPQDPVAPLSLSQTQPMNGGHSPVHSPVGRLRGDTECDTPGSPRGGDGRGELEARRELPHGGPETQPGRQALRPPPTPVSCRGPELATPGCQSGWNPGSGRAQVGSEGPETGCQRPAVSTRGSQAR